ncbi:acyl-CoA dehydrogenase family protein [Alkalibacillus salilacus]|uniref:Alkylation response protein AidB-like acyl-CoA dehydrogenase n=1 Tax=Alkalibacillus salilacus TaxID=284582 RepID=A0ABT9VHS0_9BACI|nr:acyl-CoA dehydrogenase family protein [Alkalibacillus salilacus]MDQ0160510.1 alkylation response protein AidB-like acyl-CoA dehydrogenase [Alkalibacillus salilacus]
MTQPNFYHDDPVLQSILRKQLPEKFYQYADEALAEFGERVATDIDERAAHTDRTGQPQLIKYDKWGNDVSRIWVNEGYRQTVDETYRTGIVGYVHKPIPEIGQNGNYAYSFAQGYLLSQAEPGFYCPVTLTQATAYLIDQYADDDVRERFLPHVIATSDTELYEGATFLTERQGGSDVGANVVEAVREGDHYRITGEKYFASNAGMCGVAMVLARIEGAEYGTKGLSLFCVPWEENREAGRLSVRRLKDKLGVRAVPSAEVEFDGATAYLVGDASQGFKYMMEALNLSRVCNMVASLGIMRRAYREARDYAFSREAFGGRLVDYPMVQETLVNLAAKWEVEMRASFEMIQLFDRVMPKGSDPSEHDQAMLRLYIALLKKETADQSIAFAHEAIEMHGGNGYIEDFVTPRLLRDAQVLTVWEGTANILGLEVLRLMKKYRVHETFLREMSERLTAMTGDVAEVAEPVIKAVEQLQAKLGTLAESDDTLMLKYPKQIADEMTRIYEAVVALEAAGDARGLAVAEVYVHNTFQPDDVTDLHLRHFKTIVGE